MKSQIFRLVAVIFCAVLAIFSFRGTLDPVIQQIGAGAINSHNDEYLSNAFDKALIGFGVMSAIKAGLSVIEGSTAGISVGGSFNLQVGDIVQSALDYVDIAWRTLLLGCISILSIQYLLRAATIIDSYVLGFTFSILAISLLFYWWLKRWVRIRQTLRDILSVSIVASLAIFYILPVSVWGASYLSKIITQPSIEEAQAGFAETQAVLSADDEEVEGGIFTKIKQIPERIKKVGAHLKKQAEQMSIWAIKLIVGYIFDCIVFPLSLFILLLWLSRSIMRYIFQKNLQSSFRDDLKHILIKQKAQNEG